MRALTEAINRGGAVSSVSSGQSGQAKVAVIVGQKGVFRRETHPLLFQVVDLLEREPEKRALSLRALARETGVSKSWCGVAKRYWEDRSNTEREGT